MLHAAFNHTALHHVALYTWSISSLYPTYANMLYFSAAVVPADWDVVEAGEVAALLDAPVPVPVGVVLVYDPSCPADGCSISVGLSNECLQLGHVN